MLLEMLEYATKLLSNMTATTTTTTIAATPIIHHNSSHHHTHMDTFNNSMKTIFNKTLAKVAKTNLSDYYNGQYSLPPLIANGGVANQNVAAVGNVGTGANGSIDIADVVVTSLPLPATRHLETSTFPAQTVATFIASNKNRATTIIVYPTVSPESIVIPIVSCIFGFPILALIVICCLRRRAKLARERDRRRNYDMQDHAVSLVRFSPIHRLNYRSSRAITLCPERSLSQGFTSLELDTVMEERCSDVEQTQTEILNPESPMETTSYKMSISS